MHPTDPSVDRNTAARPAPAARCAVLLAAFAAACSHDVGEGIVGRLERAVPVAPTDALVGLDPDLTPTAPLRQLAVAGVRLPRNGAADLTIAFVAFTTAAAADDGDGLGRALDRTVPPPTDTNGQDDVFLAAVVNPERTFGGQAVPTAFVQGLAPIFRDARCTRCHSYHYPGGWREQGHVGAMPKGSNAQCVDCHSSGEILVAGRAPTSIAWLAPDAEQNHTPTQDFRGKTDRELFELATSVADPQGHLQNDDKILWAIAHGRVPFRGASVGGRVPMDPQQWQNLVEAWGQSGMPFGTTTAVDDIVLASRRTAANSAGNGTASQPDVAFVPNAGYQPDAPTAAMLGTAYVAFASTSTNLTASATVRRDIFRATFEAWLGADGEVDLRYVTTVLVSTAATAGPGGNADSGAPVLDPDGDFCAFESAATNLIAGFQAAATPGRTNIYARNFGTGARALLSHAIGQASRGADGDSKRPSISSIGGVVTFDSDAADLVVDDTNGHRDVFVTDVGGATTVRRASVRTGGEQVDLDSVFSSVFVDGTTAETWIAFQSTADFGDGGAKPAIYVHQLSTTSTTRVGGSVAIANPARFTPDGGRLAFVTEAALDSANVDTNGIDDLVALDFVGFRTDGRQKFARATRSVIGADANGASANAATGAMRAQDGTFTSDQLYVFTTAATNLGRTEASDVLVDFAVDRSVPRIAAEFTSTVTRGVAPFAMTFVDRSNNATAWSWDFGDGQTSTEQNPTHVYTTPGSYTVTLTATGGSATATATKTAFAQATATPLTWASIYSTYTLASGCASSSCHNGATSARYSMTTATTAYNNMVGVNSVTGCAPQKRVATGTADNSGNSVLPRVLVSPQDCVSFRMGSLSPQAVHDIIDWIDNGVPR